MVPALPSARLNSGLAIVTSVPSGHANQCRPHREMDPFDHERRALLELVELLEISANEWRECMHQSCNQRSQMAGSRLEKHGLLCTQNYSISFGYLNDRYYFTEHSKEATVLVSDQQILARSPTKRTKKKDLINRTTFMQMSQS